ncbi:MAG: hypothetical protein DMD45_02080 [Gemmatimonadetes bacterium]|nr:MAG: hypothetical protein DMD45_02080 [Gemmatimonadota bacterium]
MRLEHRSRLLAVGTGLLGFACGGSGGGGTGPCTPGAATQLVKNGGDAQSWYFDNPLPTALSVKALDASNCAVPGVVINWTVASGAGDVSPRQSTTNANGVATTVDSVGSTATQTASATFTGLASPATFTEHATSPPTAIGATVGDNFFSPRDTVVQANGTVTWTWSGNNPHTVSFTGGPESGNPAGTPQTSGTYARTFTSPGKFNYFCKVHSTMTGTVTVVH